MKILLTGASSFTGMWFAQELANAGHDVTTTFLRNQVDYLALRQERVKKAAGVTKPVFNCPFGSPQFLQLIDQEMQWDLLCHHAAMVTDYKSPDFNVSQALANNTHNLKEVLHALIDKGCKKVLLTGSVFEQREGRGSDDLRAVSPYGLSKGFTCDYFQYYTQILNMDLGKFVIPNPFGPYEEERFTYFLMRTWAARELAPVTMPEYVRDNIHVSLLAKAYSAFVETLNNTSGFVTCHPSGYAETQGDFTKRYAQEMRQRLPWDCQFKLHTQTEFSEPKVRVNTETLNVKQLDWDESVAWDEIAHHYQQRLSVTS